jgi:non-ribosomal peptide synthetase component E (peptide arylation enzyme)
MPDPVSGERAFANVVHKPEKQMKLESLNEFVLNERKMAKFKLPERLEILVELSITNVGKINIESKMAMESASNREIKFWLIYK